MQWEYRVESFKTLEIDAMRDTLNRLGAEGWEVVTSLSTVKALNLTGNDLVLVFKRPGVGEYVDESVPY